VTDARVTQSAALALEALASDARLSQTALLAMFGPVPPMRTTQAAVLSLGEVPADKRISQVAALVLYTEFECATSRVQCWKITRRDGVVKAFTTHDGDVDFGGITYLRCASLKASAVSGTSASGQVTGDVQMSGLLSDDALDERDLYGGLYDGAIVQVFLVDWRTGVGRQLTRGLVSRVVQKENSYTLTVLTGGARLEQQPLLKVYSPLCRWEFGSAECGVNATALEVAGTVTGIAARNVVNQANRRQFGDAARIEAAGVYRNGRLTWNTGDNAGITVEVKSSSAGVVTLWKPCPFDIAIGDTYTLRPGCGKRFDEDCVGRYSNGINFGGFPDLPGDDALNLTPDRG
jgi:phage conserved hypothetical protein BR0599